MAGRFSIEAIFKARDGASRIVGKIQSRFEKFASSASRGLANVDRVMGKIHGGILKVGAGLVVAGGAAGLVAKSVIDAGADFEQAITAVGAVSLMTRDQIVDLEKRALELGATTKFTATEAANGMELMAKAGFTNAEILQGIGGILNAAAAEGAELAETASHVSNVLKGMGLATSEATRVADVLTLASARTNSSISSLGESMANVSSTARQFNIPLEDTVAAVALLQDVGLDASVAGSAVNTMLTKLAAPTDGLKKQMKKMGVSFRDAHGNMLPMTDVMAQLVKSAEKSGGNMDQVAFFAELVGLRGQKAAANLKDLFAAGKVTALTKELEGAAGSAEKMAALRMQNLRGDITLLASAVDGVKVALFNTESGPLRGVVQGMTKWVSENQKLIVSKFTKFLAKIRENLPEIVMWLKRIGTGIAVFYATAAAVKVARVAVAAFEIALAAASLAGRVLSGTVTLLGAAIRGFSLTTIVATTVTKAVTAAQWARNAAITIGTVAQMKFSAATVKGSIVTAAQTVATWARVLAQKAYNFVVGLGTAATTAYAAATATGTVATGSATLALGAFIAVAAAAAAAVGALVLAWDQWSKLDKETEGLGLGGIIGGMIEQGTLDPFKVVDEHQNKLARERSEGRRQSSGPEDRVAQSAFENVMSGTITVGTEKGATASVAQPKGNPVRLQLQPSGAQ